MPSGSIASIMLLLGLCWVKYHRSICHPADSSTMHRLHGESMLTCSPAFCLTLFKYRMFWAMVMPVLMDLSVASMSSWLGRAHGISVFMPVKTTWKHRHKVEYWVSFLCSHSWCQPKQTQQWYLHAHLYMFHTYMLLPCLNRLC